MLAIGLNTEHHAVPGRFVSFLYNMGGALVRWYRDTFAAAEHLRAREQGVDVYDALFAELPGGPSEVLVLPHFSPTGPPDFIENSRGVVTGLTLQTRRADILQGILQSAVFDLKTCSDLLPRAGLTIRRYRAAGGGSKSDAWLAAVRGHPRQAGRAGARRGGRGAGRGDPGRRGHGDVRLGGRGGRAHGGARVRLRARSRAGCPVRGALRALPQVVAAAAGLPHRRQRALAGARHRAAGYLGRIR